MLIFLKLKILFNIVRLFFLFKIKNSKHVFDDMLKVREIDTIFKGGENKNNLYIQKQLLKNNSKWNLSDCLFNF